MKRDALLSFVARAGVVGANYLSTALIARTVSVPDFGLVSFILSAQVTLATLIELGVGDALIHFASFYFGQRDPDRAQNVYKLALAVKLGLNGVVLAAAYSISQMLANQVYQNQALAFPLVSGFVLACGTSFQAYFLGVFRSERRFEWMLFALLGQYAGQVLLLIGIWQGYGMSVAGVVIAHLGGFAIFGLISAFQFPWQRVIQASITAERPAWREYRKFWQWLAINNLTLPFLLPVNVLILQLFQPSPEIARYYSAFKVAQFFWIVDQALAFFLLPFLSQVAGEGGPSGIRRLGWRLMGGVTSLGVILGAALALGAVFLIRLLYGPGYDNAVPVLYLLIPAGIFYLVYNTGSMALISLRRTDLGARLGFVGAALNLGANFTLGPRLGAESAAIAAQLTFGFLAAGVWVSVWMVLIRETTGIHEGLN